MSQCYKHHIDPTSNKNTYFMDGNLLCQFDFHLIYLKFNFVLEVIMKVHYIVNVYIQYSIKMKPVHLINIHIHMNILKSIGN
jgi:hypothetical protein